jgi:hypothetical protein
MPKLNILKGMKMMKSMMNMNGTMNDMGMNMSLQNGYEYGHVSKITTRSQQEGGKMKWSFKTDNGYQ